jgi:hypothetical protein
MNVYQMNADGTSSWVRFFTVEGPLIPDDSVECRAFFSSQPRIRIDRNTESTPRGSKAKLGDFSNLGYGSEPCFGARAKQLLGPHIDGLGQWLTLECDEAPYWLFNVTHTVDALDEANSELVRFADGKVMRIAQFVFNREMLRGQLLFQLPQRLGAPNLVTQDFVDLVHEHGLTGFCFRLLWSEENGAVSSKLKDWERPRITGLEQRQN